MAATKTDLILVVKKIQGLMQELSDYSADSEYGSLFMAYIDNSIEGLSEAEVQVSKAIEIINS